MKLMVIKIKSFQSNINQSIKQYLDELKPHLKDNINNLKKSDTWKIQLIVAINFISWGTCNAFKEYHIVIMTYDKADEVTKEHFESLLFRYQIGLETSMKVSGLIFDCVHLTAQKMKFSIKDFFSNCDQIRRKLPVWDFCCCCSKQMKTTQKIKRTINFWGYSS